MGTLRIPSLAACFGAAANNTKTIFQTDNDLILLTGAGTWAGNSHC
jgi:hypothetical protein